MGKYFVWLVGPIPWCARMVLENVGSTVIKALPPRPSAESETNHAPQAPREVGWVPNVMGKCRENTCENTWWIWDTFGKCIGICTDVFFCFFFRKAGIWSISWNKDGSKVRRRTGDRYIWHWFGRSLSKSLQRGVCSNHQEKWDRFSLPQVMFIYIYICIYIYMYIYIHIHTIIWCYYIY